MQGCPLRCTYCPQDQLRDAYGKGAKYLSLENFKLILSKVPDYVRIDFSGMSEPWANPDATAMLRHALEGGYNVTVYTTLYGMTRADAGAVVELLTKHAAQVEMLCLHLPDQNGNMRGFRPSPEYEIILAAFVEFGNSGTLRRFEAMTMDRDGGVHPQLVNIVRSLTQWRGNARAGALDTSDLGAQPVEEVPQHATPVSCMYTPFYDHNVVLPDGSVVLCCMDYSVKHRIGNLISGDYFSLFASQEMTNLRAENAKFGHSNKTICKSCSRAIRYEIVPEQKQFWKIIGAAMIPELPPQAPVLSTNDQIRSVET